MERRLWSSVVGTRVAPSRSAEERRSDLRGNGRRRPNELRCGPPSRSKRRWAATPAVILALVFGFLTPREVCVQARRVATAWAVVRAEWHHVEYEAKILQACVASKVQSLKLICDLGVEDRLGEFRNLRHLDVHSACLGLCFSRWIHLTSLELVWDVSIHHVRDDLRSLRTLRINGYVNNRSLLVISRLVQLEHLDLRRTHAVTDEGLEHLCSLTELRSLRFLALDTNAHSRLVANINGNISQGMLERLFSKIGATLEVLTINHLNVFSHKLALACPALRQLLIALDDVVYLRSVVPLLHLRVLTIESTGSVWTQHQSWKQMGTLVQLTALTLCDCSLHGELAWLANLKALQTLNLALNPMLADESLVVLASLPELRRLDLGSCNDITDAGLAHLQNLQSLSLLGCMEITDDGMAHLSRLKSLRALNLHDCRHITLHGLLDLDLPNLRSLFINHDIDLRHARLIFPRANVSNAFRYANLFDSCD